MKFSVAVDLISPELTPEEKEDEMIVFMHRVLNYCKTYDEEFSQLSNAYRFGVEKAKELKQSGEKIRAVRIVYNAEINLIDQRGDESYITLVFDEKYEVSDIFYYDNSSDKNDRRKLVEKINDDVSKKLISLSPRQCYDIIFDWLNRFGESKLKILGFEAHRAEIVLKAISALPNPKSADEATMLLVFDRILSGKEEMPFECFYSELSPYAKFAKKTLKN